MSVEPHTQEGNYILRSPYAEPVSHWELDDRESMGSLTFAPFETPKSGSIAVRIITAKGDEMTVVKEMPDSEE